MKKRTLLTLGLVTLLLVGAALWMQDEPQRSASSGGLLFPELMDSINEISRISGRSAKGAFSIVKNEAGWVVADRDNYPADAQRVREVIIGLAQLSKLQPKTTNPDLYAKLQLQDIGKSDSKARAVDLHVADDQAVVKLLVGKSKAAKGVSSQSEYYVRVPETEQSWLVQGKLDFPELPEAWLDKELLNIDQKRVHRVRVESRDGSPVEVAKPERTLEDFDLADVPEESKIKYQFAVNDIALSTAALKLKDVQAVKQSSDEQPGQSVRLQTYDGLQIDIDLVEREGQTWAQLRADYAAALVLSDADEAAAAEAVSPAKDADAGAETGEAGQQIKSADEVQAEAAALNDKWLNWRYQLDDRQLQDILKPKEELLEALAPDDEGNGGATATNGEAQ